MARRQRFFALPAGVVLAVCIVLPAVRVCGSPAYPITMPLISTPYLLGAIVAGLALVRRASALRPLVIAARVVVALTAIGWAGAAVYIGVDGVPWALLLLAIGGGFFAVTQRGSLETRAAWATIATGAMFTPWFAIFAFDKDALFGVWVSLGASMALVLAGLEWRRELRLARRDAVPRAIARTV